MKQPSVISHLPFNPSWNHQKFRWIFENRKANTSEALPLLGANIHVGVTERFEGDGRPAASEDLSKYKLVESGDIIMNPLGKPHGSIGMSIKKGITSPAYWVLRLNAMENDPRYFHYLLRSEFLIREYVRLSKNLPPNQFDLQWEQFREIELPIPPIEEQRRIADYLDEQCKSLDQISSQHEKVKANVLELTKSEREKLIRGGAEGKRIVPGWLGEIDINWHSIRLGRIASFKSGVGFPDEYQGKSFGDFPFMKVADLGSTDSFGILNRAENYIDKFEAQVLGARVAPAETIVFPKVGAALLNNRRAILGVPSIFDNNVMGLLFKEGYNRYWYHVLRSVDMGRIMNPGPVPSIGASQVSEIVLPFPPLDEQRQIAFRLDEIDDFAAKLQAKNDEAKMKIAEYKKSLISEVVLGQTQIGSRKRIS